MDGTNNEHKDEIWKNLIRKFDLPKELEKRPFSAQKLDVEAGFYTGSIQMLDKWVQQLSSETYNALLKKLIGLTDLSFFFFYKMEHFCN